MSPASGVPRLMEIVTEAGADDFMADEGGYEVLTSPEDFEAVHKAVEEAKITCETAQVTALPELTVTVPVGDVAGKVGRLVELLEDHDDVKEVFSNAEFAD